MLNKRFLFYVVSLVLCLFLLNAYKDHRAEEKQTVENIMLEQNKEKNCLINTLYYEARSESKLGILAVASVIENRKNAVGYPSTYCLVVNQNKQFSYTIENKPDVVKINHILTLYDKKSYEYIADLSDTMLKGTFETILPVGVMWYATTRVQNAWTRSKKIYATIGVHHFYKKKEQSNENKR